MLEALPPRVAEPLRQRDDRENLLEVVLDLGRAPEARVPGSEIILSDEEVTHDDLEYVVARIGTFGEDNRAGIERTLHRISCIRNRKGKIVGLTCRIGRAVYGTISIIRDIVEAGRSVLLLGRPGVGKTTMLREVARVLADDVRKRVVVVDTSNEIAGDGDIPHPGIGHARRMQVPSPNLQHGVMIEAVENHMPEVIVIDEIGTELEAQAARTIAERGVQLVGTAHGNTLENLMLNPTLSDLIGGIQSVTLSDEEARRRGTQKSILERKAPPTFDVLVEIQSWDKVAVHLDVAETVDAILRGQPLPAQLRSLNDRGEIEISLATPLSEEEGAAIPLAEPRRPRQRELDVDLLEEEVVERPRRARVSALPEPEARPSPRKPLKIYGYGVTQNRVEMAARDLHLPVEMTKDLREANAVLTLKNYYRKKPGVIQDAEENGIPVYVLKSNTVVQIQQSLVNLFDLDVPPDPVDAAMAETESAINHVLQERGSVELTPQNAYIRRLQHQMAERNNLASRSEGREPYRRVRIFETQAE
ncbi:MAG TPA: R3H domain-containing nucleic acid-binding protein [Chloroflexota bacterium]|nr:R3H domain-containing nucleic acid-binding protein [Chloroflexota bacterium]